MTSIHVACVATHAEGYFEHYMRSLQLYGYQKNYCHVLGWGTPWQGFGYKLTLFQRLLEQLPGYDIVVLTDAYDVLCTAPPGVCLERYKAMGAPVVISVNETPTSPVVRHLYGMIFPKYLDRNLNTGLWMGRVDRLRPLLKVAQPFVERYNDDQLAIIRCLIENATDDMLIDDASSLFLNVGSFESLRPEELTKACFVHGWYNTDLSPVVDKIFGPGSSAGAQPTQHYMSTQRVAHYSRLLYRLQKDRLQERLQSHRKGNAA